MTYLEGVPEIQRTKLNSFYLGYKSEQRPIFDALANVIFSVADSPKMLVHTLYVIFVDSATDKVFASVHYISAEMYLGLALPKDTDHARLLDGTILKYTGLTKAVKLESVGDVNPELSELIGVAVKSIKP